MPLPLIDFLCTLPQGAVFGICSRACLSMKRPWLYYALLCLLSAGVHVIGIHYWPGGMNAKGLITTLILFGCNLIFSRDGWRRTALLTSILCAVMVLSELLFSGLWALLFPMPYVDYIYAGGSNLALSKLLILAVFAILCCLLTWIWNRRLKRYASFYGAFALFPISQTVLIAMLINSGLSEYGGDMIYNYAAIAACVCFTADVLLFRAISRLGDQRLLESQKLLAESQLKAQTDYYERLMDAIEQVSRLRHDMGNQLQTVYSLLNSGQLSAAGGLADELQRQWGGVATREFCENSIVDAVLSEKKRRCAEGGIGLTADVRLPPSTGIEGVDLCSVFANLIDNAVSACYRLPPEQRQITLSAALTAGVLVVRASNPSPDSAAPRAAAARSGAMIEHGLGLSIIKSIAGKYAGKLDVKNENGAFTTTVWLNTGAKGAPAAHEPRA